MRFLLKAELSVEIGNAVIKNGMLAETFRSILDDLKPEAVYFPGVEWEACSLPLLERVGCLTDTHLGRSLVSRFSGKRRTRSSDDPR